jgi:hypothetical protein
VTTDVKFDAGRRALLRGVERVKRVAQKAGPVKKQKNKTAMQNWWKQGYNDAVAGDESDSSASDEEIEQVIHYSCVVFLCCDHFLGYIGAICRSRGQL